MVDKLARKRTFSPKAPVKPDPGPEQLSIDQNPLRTLCCLLGYNFLFLSHLYLWAQVRVPQFLF